jgi:hypothetical protein
MVQLGVADWDGDGRLDLLLGETLPQRAPVIAPAAAAQLDAQRRAARQVLEVVQAELARLNAAKPPIGDPGAMAAREAWRQELGRRAAGPRAVLDAARPPAATVPGGRQNALVRR